MPCRDYSEDWGPNRDRAAEKKLDKVTRLLCFTLRTLSAPVLTTLLSGNKELAEWWRAHQEEDKRRLEAERREFEKKQLKKKALSKLTQEERKALGI